MQAYIYTHQNPNPKRNDCSVDYVVDDKQNRDVRACSNGLHFSGRTCELHLNKQNVFFGCYGQDNQIEFFKILTESEVHRKHSKRVKKETKRKAEDDDLTVNPEITVSDLFRRFGRLRNRSSCQNFPYRTFSGFEY